MSLQIGGYVTFEQSGIKWRGRIVDIRREWWTPDRILSVSVDGYPHMFFLWPSDVTNA